MRKIFLFFFMFLVIKVYGMNAPYNTPETYDYGTWDAIMKDIYRQMNKLSLDITGLQRPPVEKQIIISDYQVYTKDGDITDSYVPYINWKKNADGGTYTLSISTLIFHNNNDWGGGAGVNLYSTGGGLYLETGKYLAMQGNYIVWVDKTHGERAFIRMIDASTDFTIQNSVGNLYIKTYSPYGVYLDAETPLTTIGGIKTNSIDTYTGSIIDFNAKITSNVSTGYFKEVKASTITVNVSSATWYYGDGSNLTGIPTWSVIYGSFSIIDDRFYSISQSTYNLENAHISSMTIIDNKFLEVQGSTNSLQTQITNNYNSFLSTAQKVDENYQTMMSSFGEVDNRLADKLNKSSATVTYTNYLQFIDSTTEITSRLADKMNKIADSQLDMDNYAILSSSSIGQEGTTIFYGDGQYLTGISAGATCHATLPDLITTDGHLQYISTGAYRGTQSIESNIRITSATTPSTLYLALNKPEQMFGNYWGPSIRLQGLYTSYPAVTNSNLYLYPCAPGVGSYSLIGSSSNLYLHGANLYFFSNKGTGVVSGRANLELWQTGGSYHGGATVHNGIFGGLDVTDSSAHNKGLQIDRNDGAVSCYGANTFTTTGLAYLQGGLQTNSINTYTGSEIDYNNTISTKTATAYMGNAYINTQLNLGNYSNTGIQGLTPDREGALIYCNTDQDLYIATGTVVGSWKNVRTAGAP